MSTIDTFWGRVTKSVGCWEISGADNGNGYAVIYTKGEIIYAHRFSYELHFGPIPEGKMICHHCDNRRCVRPEHLYAGSRADNMRDMVQRRRAGAWTHPEKLVRGDAHHSRVRPECMARGDRHGQRLHAPKLSKEKAREIREQAVQGKKTVDIAAHFGISRSMVTAILRGDRWAE